MEKSCMIPARYSTIFKPQKQNSLTMKKKEIFLLHTQTSLTIFFQSTRAFLLLFFSQIGNLLTIKINQQSTQNGKKRDVLQMVFSKCKHFSQKQN